MVDEREGQVSEADKPYAFNQKPLSSRIAIVLAGPLANFLFAIAAFWLLFMVGIRAFAPIVGEVLPDSPAAIAGVPEGQEIIAIDNQSTPNWQAVNLAVFARAGDSGEMVLRLQNRENQQVSEYHLPLSGQLLAEDNDILAELGLTLTIPVVKPLIGDVEPNTPAMQAGLRAGDLIVAADDQAINDWFEWVEYVQAHPLEAIRVEILRNGQQQFLTVVPQAIPSQSDEVTSIGFIGAALNESAWPEDSIRTQRYSPMTALHMGIKQVWTFSTLTVEMVYKMLTGQVGLNNLSGPIKIAQVAGQSVTSGAQYYISFLALISISIGIFNLLPIPMLDGGHLLYYLLEGIKGKPVSQHIQQVGYSIGIFVLIGLTCLALYNDLIGF